jgi:glycerophosphoryl diester phosphodiesterase
MNDGSPLARRDILRLLAAGATVASAGLLPGCTRVGLGDAKKAAPLTVAAWRATRGDTYQIAHRGAGDVYPEHTMAAYEAALGWGATCLEISVDMTSDGVLVCMHDLTLNRTTADEGLVADRTYATIAGIGIEAPQLGPGWLVPPLPSIPRLEDVLDLVAGRAVMCIEAKADAAYGPMIDLIERRGLKDSVIVKLFRGTRRIAEAKAAGYPVFVYLAAADMTEDTIKSTAAGLDPDRDYLVVPATTGDAITYYPDDLIHTAVDTGVPVWVYPIHRRSDFAHYTALGVVGAVSSSIGYTTTSTSVARADDWARKRVTAGQISRRPDDPAAAPDWTGIDELTLASAAGRQEFLLLGQLCPLVNATSTYEVRFAASWTQLPNSPVTNFTLAFGHTDDTYYEHRLGRSTGYHAIMRPPGELELYRHVAGETEGKLLGSVVTAPAVAGAWMTFSLIVSRDLLTWTRTDLPDKPAVVVQDATIRGGYLHVGRSSIDGRGVLALRQFRVV